MGALCDKWLELYFAPMRMSPGGEEATEACITVHSDAMERNVGPGFRDWPLKEEMIDARKVDSSTHIMIMLENRQDTFSLPSPCAYRTF